MGAQPKAPRKAVGRWKQGTEDALHTAVADLLNAVLASSVFWTTIEHGGYLLGKKGRGRMARHGIKPGVPDILIVHRGRALFIELKVPGATLSDDQRLVHCWLGCAGAIVVVCHSVEEVAAFLHRSQLPTLAYTINGGPRYGNSKTARSGATQPAQGTPLPPLSSGEQRWQSNADGRTAARRDPARRGH